MLGLAPGITNTSYQWQPNLVGADLKLWLRNGVGVAVGQWDDSSGNGNHVTQGTADNQAAVDDGGLEFDGSDDHYDLTAGITCSAEEGFMVFFVIRPDNVTTRTLLGIGGTAEFIEIMSNKKIRTKIDGDSDTTEFGTAFFGVDKKIILGIQREAGGTGNINIWKNGTLLTPSAQQANTGEIVFSTLGTRSTDRFFDGHMLEVLVYDTTDLTTSEIGKISNYLANKHTPLG